MPQRIRHPQLKDKFNLLYSLRINPAINRNADLARSLGVSRQAVNRWINGDMMSQGGSIPPQQLDKLSRLFSIPQYWFAESLEVFTRRLSHQVRERHSRSAAPESGAAVFTSMLPLTDPLPLGRENELAQMDVALQLPDCNLLQVIAFGGAGKTTLINAWLQRLMRCCDYRAYRVFAWSFHWRGFGREAGSSADRFVECALEWFGAADPSRGSPWSRATRLLGLIRRQPTILVLDGVESLQRPPGLEGGVIEDSSLALVLRELTSGMRGLCVITSRIELAEVRQFYGEAVRTLRLAPLDEVSGVRLLQRHGLTGEPSDFTRAVQNFRGHALSLNLLAGYLNMTSASRIECWEDVDGWQVTPGLASEPVRIMDAYSDWFQDTAELNILYLVSLFDRPIGLEFLRRVVDTGGQASFWESLRMLPGDGWRLAVHRLREAQLVTVSADDSDPHIDEHPLVRAYFAGRFRDQQPVAWKRGHLSIVDQLERGWRAQAAPERSLEPLFQAVVHACLAREYARAYALYEQDIKQGQISMFHMGSHHADLACLRQFFTEPWRQVVADLPMPARFYLLSCVAANLVTLGRIDEAISPLLQSVDGLIAQGEIQKAVVASGALVSMQLYVGNLGAAFALIERVESLVASVGSQLLGAVVDNYVGHALYLSAQPEAAASRFAAAQSVYLQESPPEPVGFPMVNCFHALFLVETGDAAAGLRHALRALQWRRDGAWQTRFDTTTLNAMDHLAAGLAWLRLGDCGQAEPYLETQIEMLRTVDDWLFLPFGLIHRSELYLAQQRHAAARADLDEALRIAGNTGARLLQRDAAYALARLCMELGDWEGVGRQLATIDRLGLEHLYPGKLALYRTLAAGSLTASGKALS